MDKIDLDIKRTIFRYEIRADKLHFETAYNSYNWGAETLYKVILELMNSSIKSDTIERNLSIFASAYKKLRLMKD